MDELYFDTLVTNVDNNGTDISQTPLLSAVQSVYSYCNGLLSQLGVMWPPLTLPMPGPGPMPPPPDPTPIIPPMP